MFPDENRKRLAGLVAGAALIGLGVLVGVSTAGMQVPPTYAKVGPQVFPYIAAALLVAAGAWFAWQAWSGGSERLHADAARADWTAVTAIAAGFVLQILFIEPLGFVVSSTLLFGAVAWGFGSRRAAPVLAWGFGLSLTAYLVFTRLLNLQLPAGIHKGLF